jgi:uncharacterized protein YndB with AHSA1/START domain
MKHLLALMLCAATASAALAAGVADTSYAAPDGARVLRHEIVVPASTTDVYRAFTTAEGWRTWAVPFAQLTPDLSVGAIMETSYNPAAKPGDANNIKNKVLAFIPDRLFAFHAVQAPQGFKHADLLARIFTVAEFEPVDANHTRIKLSMLGYGSGPGFDALYAHFAKGNAWTAQKLIERFEKGPVDWSRPKTKN